MSDQATPRATPLNDEAQFAAGSPRKRKKGNPGRTLQEWEQVAKAWKSWNPEPADAGPESLRKALFEIVDIAIKRKGEARTALEVKASEWLSWLNLPETSEVAPKDRSSAIAGLSGRTGTVTAASSSRPPAPPDPPMAEDSPGVGSAPAPRRVSATSGDSTPRPADAAASIPASSCETPDLAAIIARRMETLDAALQQRTDAILERQERSDGATHRLEQAVANATRSIPALADRIQELERSSRAGVAGIRDLQTAAATRQERAEEEVRHLLEREVGAVRAEVKNFGDALDARLRAKIDLTDVTRLLEVQEHIEERVQAEFVRRASRRIAPAVEVLRVALANGDAERSRATFDELCTACRTAGLVLDLTQIF